MLFLILILNLPELNKKKHLFDFRYGRDSKDIKWKQHRKLQNKSHDLPISLEAMKTKI